MLFAGKEGLNSKEVQGRQLPSANTLPLSQKKNEINGGKGCYFLVGYYLCRATLTATSFPLTSKGVNFTILLQSLQYLNPTPGTLTKYRTCKLPEPFVLAVDSVNQNWYSLLTVVTNSFFQVILTAKVTNTLQVLCQMLACSSAPVCQCYHIILSAEQLEP